MKTKKQKFESAVEVEPKYHCYDRTPTNSKIVHERLYHSNKIKKTTEQCMKEKDIL